MSIASIQSSAIALAAAAAAVALAGCGDPGTPPPGATAERRLLEGAEASRWSAVEAYEAGEASIADGVMRLGAGAGITGMRFAPGGEALPADGYEIELEARRVSGSDFFCGLTFPAGSLDRCVTLVVGGWGGALVGISSIDFLDASENQTRSEQSFENGAWYPIRVRVDGGFLKAWIGGRPVAQVETKGRALSMRPGDIELCQPLGLASYRTEAEVRNLVLRRLR